MEPQDEARICCRLRMLTIGTASAQVFGIPELLETILLFLPQKDILLAQRVCRMFQLTIKGSTGLQKALFFVSDWKASDRSRRCIARKPENNRLLLKAFPENYPTVALILLHDAPTPQDLVDGREVSEHWSWDVYISFPADVLPPSTKQAVLYPEASWRRMLLSQPPCTSLHLVRRWQRMSIPAIVRDGGITMGEFVEEVTGTQSWHRSYISSDRDWHFAGNIDYSSVVEEKHTNAEQLTARFRRYLFSNGET